MYDLSNDKKSATRDGFGKAIADIGKDKRLVVMSAGVGDSTKAFNFKEKYPERYVETGIAEQNMIAMAAGLALSGKTVFATSFASFMPGRCFDQIRQSVCYSNLDVKLVSTHAGLTVGADGATHQMMEDISMMRALPGLKIIVPCDSLEAEKATKAIASEKGPYYMRLGREKIPIFTKNTTRFEIGKANLMKKGEHITIVATGIMVYHSLVAAQYLEKEGISASVLNMHTIKPLDKKALISEAKRTKLVLTVEEHQIYGGLGGAVAEALGQECPVRMKIMGMEDVFGESGGTPELMNKYGLTSKSIVKQVKRLLKKKVL